MKKSTRALALLMVLVMAFATTSTLVSAADWKYGTNVTAYVATGKAPWWLWWQSPTIKVTNEDDKPMTVIIYRDGKQYKRLNALKAGKSHTFSLNGNAEYKVVTYGNAYCGWYVKGCVEAGRYINNIW